MYRAAMIAAVAALAVSAQEIRDTIDIVGWEGESLQKWDLSMVRGLRPSMIILLAVDTLDSGGEAGTVQFPFQKIRTVRFIFNPRGNCTSSGVEQKELRESDARSPLIPLADAGSGTRWVIYDLGGRLIMEIDHPRILER